MRSPHTGKPMHEVEGEARLHTFRGEEFMLSSPSWECPATGERYFTPEQGDVFLARVHVAWRKHQGIAKEMLHQRRKALGLSAAQASALLGFGINQYRTYENTDKLPSKSNARLLRLLLEDRALPALVEAAGSALSKSARLKLQLHLAQLPLTSLTAANLTATAVRLLGFDDRLGTPAAIVNEQFNLISDYSFALAA